MSYRVLEHAKERGRQTGNPVALYGAGTAGALALREVWSNDVLTLRPVAFLDDDPTMKGTFLNGVNVVGGLEAIRELPIPAEAAPSQVGPEVRPEEAE